MKLLVFVSLILILGTVVAQFKSAKVTENVNVAHSDIQSGTFVTKLDHFRPQDARTVEMVSD